MLMQNLSQQKLVPAAETGLQHTRTCGCRSHKNGEDANTHNAASTLRYSTTTDCRHGINNNQINMMQMRCSQVAGADNGAAATPHPTPTMARQPSNVTTQCACQPPGGKTHSGVKPSFHSQRPSLVPWLQAQLFGQVPQLDPLQLHPAGHQQTRQYVASMCCCYQVSNRRTNQCRSLQTGTKFMVWHHERPQQHHSNATAVWQGCVYTRMHPSHSPGVVNKASSVTCMA